MLDIVNKETVCLLFNMTSVHVQTSPDAGLPSLARNAGLKKKNSLAVPPPMNVDDIPWRGQGGRAPTLSSIEFDKQLDKIAVWMEEWTHDQVGAL